MNPGEPIVEDALKSFMKEDVGYGDITTNALTDSGRRGEARIVCKEDAVVAGIAEILVLLRLAGCEGAAKVQESAHCRFEKVLTVAIGSLGRVHGLPRLQLSRPKLELSCEDSCC